MKKIVLTLSISIFSIYCADQSRENSVGRLQAILGHMYNRTPHEQTELERLSIDFVAKLKNPNARTLIDAAHISQSVTYSHNVPFVLGDGLQQAAQTEGVPLGHPSDKRTLGLILRAGRSTGTDKIESDELFRLLGLLFAPDDI